LAFPGRQTSAVNDDLLLPGRRGRSWTRRQLAAATIEVGTAAALIMVTLAAANAINPQQTIAMLVESTGMITAGWIALKA